MPIVLADAAQAFTLPGVRFTGLASPSRGAVENSAWLLTVEPRSQGARHSVTREEIFIATAGHGEISMEGATHPLAPGDAAIVPAGSEFSLANPHEEPFCAVVVLPVGGQAVTQDGTFTPPWAL